MISPEASVALEQDVMLKKIESIKVEFPPMATDTTFLLVRHRYAEDLPPDFADMIASTDVVLLEGALWTPQVLADYNRISCGDKDTYALTHPSTRVRGALGGFHQRIYDTLYGSKKPVRLCDVPMTKNNVSQHQASRVKVTIPDGCSLDTVTAILRRAYDPIARKAWFERDKYMLRNVYPLVSEAATTHDLSEPLKALFVVGALHRSLPHVIQRRIQQAGAHEQHSVRSITYGVVDHPTNDLYWNFLQGKPFNDEHLLGAYLSDVGVEAADTTDISYEELKRLLAKHLGRSCFTSPAQPVL